MGGMADPKRTAPGFAELRRRFVRRAEFLCLQSGYRNTMKEGRRFWTETYPRYPLSAKGIGHDGMPDRLQKDVKQAWDTDTSEWQRPLSDAERALTAWNRMVEGFASSYWPDPDFPPLALSEGHPARRFVAMSLCQDPRAYSEKCNEFFEEFALNLVPVPQRRGMEAQDFDTFMQTTAFAIPIYPGITAKDIDEAKQKIIRESEMLYGKRTTTYRIAELDRQGLSHQEIANRLGVGKNTVTATIKSFKTRTGP